MLKLLEEGDLPDGGTGDPLVLRLKPDLLHRHDLPGLVVLAWKCQFRKCELKGSINTFEHDSICSLSNLFNLDKILQLISCRTGAHLYSTVRVFWNIRSLQF